MMEERRDKVLIIDAAGVGGGDFTAAGWLVADPARDDPEALLAEFKAGTGAAESGNVIYLYDGRAGAGIRAKADIRARALSLAPGIRVNAVCLQNGMTDIEQWSSHSLGFMVRTEEIVAAVRFILDTAPITGQMISLDGLAGR